MKKVLISGYYGFDNIGDEAILSAIHQLLEPHGVELTVLSSQVPHTLTGKTLPAIARLNLPQIIKELKKTDLFISGGGGLFQDVTGFGSIPYYGGLLTLARKCGVPTMIFAQGIGPVRYGFDRFMLRHLLSKVNAVTVRDPASVDDLLEMGLAPSQVHLTADPVLALQPIRQEAAWEILYEREGLFPDRPIIAVAIRPWHSWYEKQLKSFTAVLTQFTYKIGGQLLLIPFQKAHDEWLAYEAGYSMSCRTADHLPPIFVLQQHYTPQEMMGIIGETAMMVGMRLHALIMAAARSIPAVGVVYDPKVRLFSESMKYNYTSSISALSDSDAFNRQLWDTWDNRYQINQYLHTSLPLFYKRIEEAVNLALELLKLPANAKHG